MGFFISHLKVIILTIQADKHIWQQLSTKACDSSQHSDAHKQTLVLEFAGARL